LSWPLNNDHRKEAVFPPNFSRRHRHPNANGPFGAIHRNRPQFEWPGVGKSGPQQARATLYWGIAAQLKPQLPVLECPTRLHPAQPTGKDGAPMAMPQKRGPRPSPARSRRSRPPIGTTLRCWLITRRAAKTRPSGQGGIFRKWSRCGLFGPIRSLIRKQVRRLRSASRMSSNRVIMKAWRGIGAAQSENIRAICGLQGELMFETAADASAFEASRLWRRKRPGYRL